MRAKIKTSLLKRYLFHYKQYVNVHIAWTKEFPIQAFQLYIFWKTLWVSIQETLWAIPLFSSFNIFREAYRLINAFKFRCTISSDLNKGDKKWMQCWILTFLHSQVADSVPLKATPKHISGSKFTPYICWYKITYNREI